MKLVIWDADETLWEGKIMYGDVNLKKEAMEVLKQIHKLGVKQHICSKNDEAPLLKQLDEFGLMKYLDGVIANWKPKNENIRGLLEIYNVSKDETLFVDDEPINREEIKELVGCHVDYETDLYKILKYFDTDRLKLMNQQRNRNMAEKTHNGSFKDFLENSGMVCTIKPGHRGMLTRLTNLANRTNELNVCRNRYTEKEIEFFLNADSYKVWVASLKDKFGDYGIIAEVIVKATQTTNPFMVEWFVQDLCVSCRTMGRGIGYKLLEYVKKQAKRNNIAFLTGIIKENKDNFRMKNLYDKCGFTLYGDDGNGEKHYKYNC